MACHHGAYEREHLYELEGFRALFDQEQLDGLKPGELVPNRQCEIPDEFYVLARKGKSSVPLGNMRLISAGMDDGKVGVRLESPNGRVAFLFWMDFRNERLLIDPLGGCGLLNERRKNRSDIQSELSLQEFKFALYCNASVEVWSSNLQQRLGKSEPFVLFNAMPDLAGHRQIIDELKAALERMPQEDGD